jgi:FMN phosphatase YigB (HAD superfamily)
VTLGSGPRGLDAVVFDLDDVLVPFHSVRLWQWAWHPQGPLLGERRAQSTLRRSLHAWDRRRWLGVAGRAAPADAAALHQHLAETLSALAGHALPAEETEAVVRRVLHPSGEVERYADVPPALDRLGQLSVKVAVLTPLPAEAASWLLRRVGLRGELLIGAGDGPGPCVPSREAFRAATERLDVPPARTAFVGDLYWSDVRAAHRAGLRGLLLDRSGAWPHVRAGRMTTLEQLEAGLSAQPEDEPVGDDGPESSAGGGAGPDSGAFL